MKVKTVKSIITIIGIFLCLLTGVLYIGCSESNKKKLIAIDGFEKQVETVLAEAEKYLTDYPYEIHTFSLNDELILSLWVMLPEIITDLQDISITENSNKVFNWARETVHTLLKRIPDIFVIFDAINPMVVDTNYTIWYRDIIPLYIFQGFKKNNQEEALKIYQGKFIYRRSTPVKWTSISETNLYKWKEVRMKIDSTINPYEQIKNYAAYPIVFDDYSMIQVYIIAVNEKEMEDPVFYEKIDSLLQIFSQGSIIVDMIQIGILSLKGPMVKSCMIQKSVLKNYNPDAIKKIRIISGNW